jgi:DNA-binding NarL/FixJ family response regulator
MTEKVYITIDGERIELIGSGLTAHLEQQAKNAAAELEFMNQVQADLASKATVRQSAISKLIALGLTEEEIEAL